MNIQTPNSMEELAEHALELPASAPYPKPVNEEARLEALYGLKILDTAREERFDRIARLAAAHFGTPMSRITFVDKSRTWYKACAGPEAIESPRNIAICAHAVMSNDLLISCDLSKDPRFRDSPQVMNAPHLRFYAASPIIMSDGMRVGSLCIIDVEPRAHFSREDQEFLSDMAQIVVHELELHALVANKESSLADAERREAVSRRAKDRFMGIVSHELKTPLGHILGFGKILAEQQFGKLGNDEYVEFASNLYQSAEHLQGLINRVIDYTSAEAGELMLSESTADTEFIATKCAQLVRARSRAANVQVETIFNGNIPASVFVDEVQIVEAIVQILDNAISFSPKGDTVKLNFASGMDGGLCVQILDRGPGIDPEKLHQVMHPFTQGNDSQSRPHDGIGLGLTVARTIMQLHGGAMRLSNRDGGGALVEAYLPANRNRTQEDAMSTVYLPDLPSETIELKMKTVAI